MGNLVMVPLQAGMRNAERGLMFLESMLVAFIPSEVPRWRDHKMSTPLTLSPVQYIKELPTAKKGNPTINVKLERS